MVQRKRARGQLTESLILMRMGVQASKQAGAAQGPDDVSRLALQRYLELMPDDADVRRALHALGDAPASPHKPGRLGRLWACMASGRPL